MNARRSRLLFSLAASAFLVGLAATAVADEGAPAQPSAREAEYRAQMRAWLDEDIEERIQKAKKTFGDDVPVRVVSGLFVMVAAERGVDLDAAVDFAQRTLDVYLGSFFARRPDRAVTVEIVRSRSAFAARCRTASDFRCEGDLGAYLRRTRTMIVNVGPGLPTLSHELVHPLVQTDFPTAPAWLDEGLGALFEMPVFEPAGQMHGVDNWRYARLTHVLASPQDGDKVHLQALFAMKDDDAFDRDGQALHYGEARALCQWLDERGWLWGFYRAWREGREEDPSGEASFQRVTGMTPTEADGAWREWVKGRKGQP